jgi:NADH-quinone oxidoreductase subunit D
MQRTVEIVPENLEIMTLNMGPQHPSTHGVLRLVIDLEGEVIRKIAPVVGYLHRAKEKTAEVKTYHQFIPYTDRLDYLSPMSNNYAYISTVEKLLGIEVTPRCTYLRTILCELARISSHLLWLGSQALELGAQTIFLYTFRERETIYDFFELICGHRFTVSYMRVGGVARDMPPSWLEKVRAFTEDFPKLITEYEDILTMNEIFLQRTKGVGVISAADATDLGLSGPSLRGSNVPWDIRKSNPYLVYGDLDWEMAVETGCDVYARYLVRIEEMRQSNRIIQQCIERMPEGPVNIDNPKIIYPPRENVHKSMEDLIHHFMLAYEGFRAPEGEVYNSIEAPKGELGFYIYSDGSNKPYRLKIRSPSFVNLQSLSKMCEGRLFADVVAVIGSLDIVLGESDR